MSENEKQSEQKVYFKLDGIGNAQRFAWHHIGDVRHVRAWDRWLHWRETHWVGNSEVDQEGFDEALRLAKVVARSIYDQAASADDPKAVRAWAKQSCSAAGVKAMLELAQTEDGIMTRGSEFDADPWLINALNGTIDLRTGKLRKHRRDDLITKLIPVEFDLNATFPMWDEFLQKVVPDPELRDFLQRAVGYSLTGLTSEEKFFFVYGPTASGKSTFLNALLRLLGEYATTASFKMFLEQGNDGEYPRDLWRHEGSRLIVAQEVKAGQRFDPACIKLMGSGERMTARRLFCDPFEFMPRWKTWLAANDRPEVDVEDEAMWRRIVVIPFDVSLPEGERNPLVKQTLAGGPTTGPDPVAQAAILAWAVRGCLMWQKQPLVVPEPVRRANQDYRQANDPFTEFLEERFEMGGEAFVEASLLRETYEGWCRTNRVQPMSEVAMAKKLDERKFVAERVNIKGKGTTRIRRGLRKRGTNVVGEEQEWRGVAD